MKSWKTEAAQDDPNVWSDVSGLWPTKRGTYKTAEMYAAASQKTATGESSSTEKFAFCAPKVSGTRAYVCGTKTWEVASNFNLIDRTGGVGVPQMMAQFGDATVGACGNNTATVVSTGGNFSNLAGAPRGNIVVEQSGAMLIFNTDTANDGWAASDIGDYTNWTTGESQNGRLYQAPGPILAAIAYSDYVLAFKPGAIFRGRYVGGVDVKWAWEIVWRAYGMRYDATNESLGIRHLCVCDDGVAFRGPSSGGEGIYLFDGVGCRHLNPDHRLSNYIVANSSFTFDPEGARLIISGGQQVPLVYSFKTDQWGQGSLGEALPNIVVTGDRNSVMAHYGIAGTLHPGWTNGANTFSLYSPGTQLIETIQTIRTSKYGRADLKTCFDRLTPRIRSRALTPYGIINGSSLGLTFDLFRELEDTSSVASNAITESTQRNRFDLTGVAHTDNFGRFTLTLTNLTVELEDVDVKMHEAGEN